MAFIDDLLQAIERKDNDRAKQLINECNDVNADKKDHKTALGHVVGLGNKGIVKLLLDKGASMEVDDYWGGTAIHYAAAIGDMDMTELLVRRGGDVNAKTKRGLTAMHWSARENKSAEQHEAMLRKFIELGADLNGDVAAEYANSSLVRLGFCKVLAILGDKLDWSQSSLKDRFEYDREFGELFESDIHTLQIAAMLNVLKGLIKSPEFENKDKYIAQVSSRLDKVIQDTDLINSVDLFENEICEMLGSMVGLGYFLEAYKDFPEDLKQLELYAKLESFKSQLDNLVEPLMEHFNTMRAHNHRLYFKSIKSDEFELKELRSYNNIQYEVERLSNTKKIWSHVQNTFQDHYAELADGVQKYLDFYIVELGLVKDASQKSHEAKLNPFNELEGVPQGYVKEFLNSKLFALKVLYWSQYNLPKELEGYLSDMLCPEDELKSKKCEINKLKLLPPTDYQAVESEQPLDGVEESKQAVGELPNEA